MTNCIWDYLDQLLKNTTWNSLAMITRLDAKGPLNNKRNIRDSHKGHQNYPTFIFTSIKTSRKIGGRSLVRFKENKLPKAIFWKQTQIRGSLGCQTLQKLGDKNCSRIGFWKCSPYFTLWFQITFFQTWKHVFLNYYKVACLDPKGFNIANDLIQTDVHSFNSFKI